ncbi:flagellin modification protein FlmH [Phenylobacterium zucineum HLK1]|uniref:Flagellin modification protein FlmH n=1 Tax=Phenylobacterium zucineum (strain HLK1) TaxID=450851 RepID=B4RH61_PHEZH|nr:UDP-4-amino-4,6-dideoxy-N-acetyl-beta-L-altrosamine N-acetyltransferase [Phenylobacterium zucineum]ACG79009.1 flagellin modification protein FlmH [Phenylobacterium zucineum HLK1]
MSVRLRKVEHEDSARLLEWRNSPDVSAFMYTDHRIGQAEHDRWFAAALTAEDRRYWIIEMDGRPVGLANLTRIDPIVRRCDWAYYLADPSTRGRGVGAQVEYIVLRHVFETMNFNKLWCEVLKENEAVWKLHESFGFRREAEYREHVCKGGRFQDVVGLGMLKADWAGARPAVEARLREKGIDPAALPDAP